MRRIGKAIGYTALGMGAVGAYVYNGTRPSSTAMPPAPGPELSGEQWNEKQDRDAVARGFASLDALRQSQPVLYWLHGCPYCARVKALLDFNDVPYSPITVDPVNFEQLNPMPYKACPQLQLVSPPGDAPKAHPDYAITMRGPMVADSEVIIGSVAKAAGVDLAEPRVAARRTWITRDVARLVFVTGSSSFSRAYALMPMVTPEKYHGIVYRAGGAFAMSMLAKHKIAARVAKQYEELGSEVKPEVKEAIGTGPFTPEVADRVLRAELKAYAAEAQPFHGGKRPDFVDVELYGLLRSQEAHAPISDSVSDAGLSEWYAKMGRIVRSSALTDRIGM